MPKKDEQIDTTAGAKDNKKDEKEKEKVLRDDKGRRPVNGHYDKFQHDPHFKDHILFYEYFHGDTGRGMGASHQTGWTGLIAEIIHKLYQ